MFRYLLVAIATIFMSWQLFTTNAMAANFTESSARIVKQNDNQSYTLSSDELAIGKKLFNSACANCHVGGITYTNPNVDLNLQTLALATPPRDSIDSLVDYLKNPTTFDGEVEISEIHPSLKSTEIFPMMRGLTDEQLKDISGYILYKGQLEGIKWGGGKIYY
ncbi:Cytochrome c-550 [Thalassoporum mexicanum PCC 7367]|uniref:photosystem II cytochrome c-550 n=1 Tax=Thalassoporum mexicanum TaxID=3457544 RepID=UPI00029FAA3E|nr:photosystem II cytochrome c-550 [Pseudanabaena sp. PCC 7367]AFY70658.1 Cytochrome c-550 [Pseudanabaena sp. PCC 7367]